MSSALEFEHSSVQFGDGSQSLCGKQWAVFLLLVVTER
jgi:hypothetical protein